MNSIKDDAYAMIEESISRVLPYEETVKVLKGRNFHDGKIIVVAVGKAAWTMAKAAKDTLGTSINGGIVITKYHHSNGDIEGFEIYEAGHPIPDQNSYKATEKAIAYVNNLTDRDNVIFLLSGGASALFEKPLIGKEEIEDINSRLLASGADIKEINTIRKRLSAVKGGRFGKLCEPAKILSIVLSDVLGNRLDIIGSGPCYKDETDYKDAIKIIDKYHLELSDDALKALRKETPKKLNNVETVIIGSCKDLCNAARNKAEELGYKIMPLSDEINMEARKLGLYLSSLAVKHNETDKSLAFIGGGETIVHLKGKGKGGRNCEVALSAAEGLEDLKDVLVFALGSDGTDGPTDVAGAYTDETSFNRLKEKGTDTEEVLDNNDSYTALEKIDGLIVTGPTGTNVNDLYVLLIKRQFT